MLISVVIPVFNEEQCLPLLMDSLSTVLSRIGYDYEVIFVDDGSQDGTRLRLRDAAAADLRVKILEFSRNFGHQAAITAGLDFATGHCVVVMDADLQDPPELIPEMVSRFEQGFDVVSAQRISRDGDGFIKRGTASMFYMLMRIAVDERLRQEVGDFRLFSRQAVIALRGFREQHRFMRGLVAWLGLNEAIIPFHRASRAAGTTKYPFWKMVRFAWTAISSFSALPLKASFYAGVATASCGFLYSAYAIYETIVLRTTVPGWSSIVCLQLFFNGAILMAVGLIGDYVGRIYDESKGRPLYVLHDALNFRSPIQVPPRAVLLSEREEPPHEVC